MPSITRSQRKNIFSSQTEVNQHIDKLVGKRRVPRVNYAGMDMNNEDEGEIYVNKRWFEDGKVKYIWKKYPLSMANEIDDDDYLVE